MKLLVEDVSKQFKAPGRGGQLVAAVARASLAVSPGEVHVVSGPSGCGKSTLMSLAAGLARPTKGRVLWDGVPAGPAALLSAEKGPRVAIAFQEAPFVSELTLIENLLLPGTFASLPKISVRAEKLLERLGLADRRSWLPAALSGGERRRLAVARALVGMPELIVLDEPTADLDRKWADELIDLVLGRAKKLEAALLIASHDPGLLERATHRHRMDAGVLDSAPA